MLEGYDLVGTRQPAGSRGNPAFRPSRVNLAPGPTGLLFVHFVLDIFTPFVVKSGTLRCKELDMKPLVKVSAVICCSLLIALACANASTVSVDPSASWIGYMNVFAIPQQGGAFSFGSSWGTADLTATFSGPVLTLGPNTIGDPSSFWYTPSGGPGAVGNKTMDANMYVETTGVYTGQTLTFAGDVLANTLVGHVNQLGNGWTSVAFIKDFAPDYSSSVSVTAPLVNGVFNISLLTVNDPTRHIQYGFETIGPDVWITDVGPYGSIQITAVPEPSALGLIGLGVIGLIRSRRMRK